MSVAAEYPLEFAGCSPLLVLLTLSILGLLQSNPSPLSLLPLHVAQTFESSLEPSAFGQFVSMVSFAV